MNRIILREHLIRDEGMLLTPYKDSVGKLTIGVGRNLDDRGISEDEAYHLLGNDMTIAMHDLDRNVPWWGEMPEAAQLGLANMCFNMGWPRLLGFHQMLGHLEARRFLLAADEALNSKWAKQVGPRAERIAQLYRDAAK